MKFSLFAILALPLSLFAQGGLPNQPYLYVEGKAEAEKPAEMVTLRFRAVTRNAEQAKANQEVQAKAATILAIFDERKIAKNDVIAEDLMSEPQYEDEEESYRKRGKIIGYSVTRPFEARIRNVPIFAKVVDELIALGSVEFTGIEGGLADKQKIQTNVQEKALANAQQQAEKTLKGLGMKIDSVFAISPVPFPDIREKILGARTEYGSATTNRASSPDPLQYRLAPVSINQSVHVIYLISPAK